MEGRIGTAIATCALLLSATAASAQATAPCKTFAGAISKTAAGGEIDALDDGGFGAMTITKSIQTHVDNRIIGTGSGALTPVMF